MTEHGPHGQQHHSGEELHHENGHDDSHAAQDHHAETAHGATPESHGPSQETLEAAKEQLGHGVETLLQNAAASSEVIGHTREGISGPLHGDPAAPSSEPTLLAKGLAQLSKLPKVGALIAGILLAAPSALLAQRSSPEELARAAIAKGTADGTLTPLGPSAAATTPLFVGIFKFLLSALPIVGPLYFNARQHYRNAVMSEPNRMALDNAGWGVLKGLGTGVLAAGLVNILTGGAPIAAIGAAAAVNMGWGYRERVKAKRHFFRRNEIMEEVEMPSGDKEMVFSLDDGMTRAADMDSIMRRIEESKGTPTSVFKGKSIHAVIEALGKRAADGGGVNPFKGIIEKLEKALADKTDTKEIDHKIKGLEEELHDLDEDPDPETTRPLAHEVNRRIRRLKLDLKDLKDPDSPERKELILGKEEEVKDIEPQIQSQIARKKRKDDEAKSLEEEIKAMRTPKPIPDHSREIADITREIGEIDSSFAAIDEELSRVIVPPLPERRTELEGQKRTLTQQKQTLKERIEQRRREEEKAKDGQGKSKREMEAETALRKSASEAREASQAASDKIDELRSKQARLTREVAKLRDPTSPTVTTATKAKNREITAAEEDKNDLINKKRRELKAAQEEKRKKQAESELDRHQVEKILMDGFLTISGTRESTLDDLITSLRVDEETRTALREFLRKGVAKGIDEAKKKETIETLKKGLPGFGNENISKPLVLDSFVNKNPNALRQWFRKSTKIRNWITEPFSAQVNFVDSTSKNPERRLAYLNALVRNITNVSVKGTHYTKEQALDMILSAEKAMQQGRPPDPSIAVINEAIAKKYEKHLAMLDENGSPVPGFISKVIRAKLESWSPWAGGLFGTVIKSSR